MIRIAKDVHERYVRIMNDNHEILIIDSHPTQGGLYFWVFPTRFDEDLTSGDRLKMIGVDLV